MRFRSARKESIMSLNSASESVIDRTKEDASPTISEEAFFTFAKSLPLHVYVDPEIRSYLNMANSERKARICLPREIDEKLTQQSIREIIENKFPRLTNQPYVLRFLTAGATSAPRKFANDDEVMEVIDHAAANTPSLQLYVDGVPGQFPPPEKEYMQGMADPAESPTMTVLSFYRFGDIKDPESVAQTLQELWKPFRAVGRVYVATEGVNAQMSVPTNVLENFKAACESLPLFSGLYLNCDHQMTTQEFDESKPFRALHVRVREQIVADGFKEPLDWEKAGREVPPLEWHKELDNPEAIILDCRNTYESDVGIFQNAIPLNTTFFRESWDAMDEILKNTPKDAPILTYCTGGIRCVKINAYLEQKLGFSNVGRLQGGIISYTKEVDQLMKEQQQQQGQGGEQGIEASSKVEELVDEAPEKVHLTRDVSESKFKGVNYVFDERMGARITADVLSTCETCGTACDQFLNCGNFNCHIRFIQCPSCRGSYGGCCSKYCQHELDDFHASEKTALEAQQLQQQFQQQQRAKKNAKKVATGAAVYNKAMLARRPTAAKSQEASGADSAEGSSPRKDHASALDAQVAALSTYCERLSDQEPRLLEELRNETQLVYKHAARMVSGPLQGRILSTLTSISGASSVLELGTFTGYSALCFAEGLQAGGTVDTCEIDPQAAEMSQRYFDKSEHGSKITLNRMRASELINNARSEGKRYDIAFIDADKKYYKDYLRDLIGEAPCIDVSNKSAIAAADSTSAGTGPLAPLLNDGALVVVDNTLWKGLVLKHTEDLQEFAPEAALYGNADRMNVIAEKMHEFNTWLSEHPKLSVIMLPLRDGLTIIRYKA